MKALTNSISAHVDLRCPRALEHPRECHWRKLCDAISKICNCSFPYFKKKTCIISQINSGLNAKTKGESIEAIDSSACKLIEKKPWERVWLIVLVNGHVAPCVSYFFPIYTLCKEISIYLQYFSTKLGCHVNGFVLFFVFVIIVVNQIDMSTWIHHLVECVRTLNCFNLCLCSHLFVRQCLIHTLFPHHFKSFLLLCPEQCHCMYSVLFHWIPSS